MNNIDSPETEVPLAPRLSNGSITKPVKNSKSSTKPSSTNKTCSIS